MNIAMWSGPRNLSTALMYAFAARGDCAVMDEPFYAACLAATGLDHAMRAEIRAAQPTDPGDVARRFPPRSPVWPKRHRRFTTASRRMRCGLSPVDPRAAHRHATPGPTQTQRTAECRSSHHRG
jgi:hypothetical protein